MKKVNEDIVNLMFEKYALEISIFSDGFLEKAISSRMSATGVEKPAQYLNKLSDDQPEAMLFRDSLSNSYSAFYRNPLTFDLLYQFVLPKIAIDKEKEHDHEIRIWSAGCASGQEAYSLAMLADDIKSKTRASLKYRIFATDNLPGELETASKGLYTSDEIKNLPYKYVEKYLTRSGELFAINEDLKLNVEFSEYDLLDNNSTAPPASVFGDFDLVMCSNVLLYYKPSVQKIILEKFSRSICTRGFLVTGEAETGIVSTVRGFRHYLSPAAVFFKE